MNENEYDKVFGSVAQYFGSQLSTPKRHIIGFFILKVCLSQWSSWW